MTDSPHGPESYGTLDRRKYFPCYSRALKKGLNRLRTVQRFLSEDTTARILELGSGSGAFLLGLRYSGYINSEGCEISDELVAHSRNELGVNLKCEDANTFLNGQRQPADLIFAFDLLEHLSWDELVDLLQRIQKSLTSKGAFVGVTPNGQCPYAYYYAIADHTHKLILTPRTLRFAAKQAGLTVKTQAYYLGGRLTGMIDRALKSLAYPYLACRHFFFFHHLPKHITANMLFECRRTGDPQSL